MQSAITTIIQNATQGSETGKNEYLANDGLLHCKKCGNAVETIINIFGAERKVRCICQCKQKEIEAEKAKDRLEERERIRDICFSETKNMKKWNFANDDGKNPKISNAMKKYAEGFKDFKRESKGLILYGSVGTGKTYYAACIANALIDNGYTALMTNFAELTNRMQGMFEGKQEYISSLNRYSLLIIDDLGAERKSEYMQEMVFNIIDSRYRSGLPFIITTNLTADELKKPQDVGYSRIYDRILERCFPVAVAGNSRRREELKETYYQTAERLGL